MQLHHGAGRKFDLNSVSVQRKMDKMRLFVLECGDVQHGVSQTQHLPCHAVQQHSFDRHIADHIDKFFALRVKLGIRVLIVLAVDIDEGFPKFCTAENLPVLPRHLLLERTLLRL